MRFLRIPAFFVLAGLGVVLIERSGLLYLGPQLRADDQNSSQPADASPPRFTEHLLMDTYTYPYGIAAADLDGDGDLDLTSADALPNNSLYWFENQGDGRFQRHFIQNDDPERLERHAVGDVNQDGHPDVVIVKNLRGDLLWFENSGRPADGKLWQRHVITEGELPGAYDVALADFDNDGDLDVAASSWRLGNEFAWFENDGSPEDGTWRKHVIEADVAETRTIRTADFDRDGDMDLLGSARVAGLVLWYENQAGPEGVTWKRHVIDTAPAAAHGEPADLDQDGDLDVVMAMGMATKPGEDVVHQIVWYENQGTPDGLTWKRHVIRAPFEQAFEAVAGDLDGDGDLDVAATAWGDVGRIVWFENSGNPSGRWKMHTLKSPWIRANQVIAADLNGDGALDLAAVAERGSLEFRWWENQGRQNK